jgi:vancomycin B-type resistance protein vanW
MKRLRKIAKKILQNWRKFRRRKLKNNIKQEEMFSDLLHRQKISYDTDNKNHVINMELINKEINGIVLLPNEIFSFNINCGERTEEKGYKSGPVYVRGKITKDIGGGICQAVTGLYNCAIFSDIKILERKAHPKVSEYIAPGKDATVYYGLIDLVFKNTRKHPIKIVVYLEKVNGTHVFEMWGRNSEKINVKLSQKVKENKKEIIVTTYREIYREGKLLKKEKISKDKYKKD